MASEYVFDVYDSSHIKSKDAARKRILVLGKHIATAGNVSLTPSCGQIRRQGIFFCSYKLAIQSVLGEKHTYHTTSEA